ncbi:amino acid permease-domain-containing protein [Boeremia exigua]|uniref:amino acid permease-domain-containing protein n=1 Tax=Boeremia exigua TaxID=749465 RepID=UPI001E8E0B04|nr:amino acid permease-domain-containing protein [Boeremia exigua]KAH6612597.1 amino acid permease-domain-containing protein [Boeremia exigua]
MADVSNERPGRMPPRSRSNFAAKTATDTSQRLHRRSFAESSPPPNESTPLLHAAQAPDAQEEDHGVEWLRSWFCNTFHLSRTKSHSSSQHGHRRVPSEVSKPRPGAFPRPVGGTDKLGTFAGVFVPVTLNVLSILMFLRFGFILGQTGVVGMMGMLVAGYAINLLTTMSISAIATNGTVRGGGAYYLISRSLGPEFGGSIGIVFYLGLVFSTSLNAVGLIDCSIENFGSLTGSMSQWMPQSYWWKFLWATLVLLACTLICLAGSGLFARCSNGLLVILLIAIVSIPVSAMVKDPYVDDKHGIVFTGFSLDTLSDNMMPRFTKGAAGSVTKHRESFQDLFGILFPATGGILAGASMSGDLKHPSKAIPKGTLYGLGLTFILYTTVILAMASSIGRESLYNNTNVIQLTNLSGVVILLGEYATSLFSVLMGVIGSAKLLQALARDHLIPGLSIFGQGTKTKDEPIYAIVFTYVLAQLTMFADINQIASFITMTYLMTFLVTNLACFLLKIGSAPNFRPSFHFFNWQTAAMGTVVCGTTMFFVDGFYASGCVALLLTVFILIHYTTPPKPWGDVSQGLIYHQVRKYLLRLRQEHVKFWRPQILLLVNDPRRQYKLIQFCNSLKKGGLFVLGHVIVSQDFGEAVPEARRQQALWLKYIDFSKIKAFVNVAISPAVEWGARNLVLGAGLGGMRPNIVVMGSYNLTELRNSQPSLGIPSPQPSRPTSKSTNQSISRQAIQAAARRKQTDKVTGMLPTDTIRPEGSVGIQSYVTTIEDLVLRLQMNVAIAKGFKDLELPASRPPMMKRALGQWGLADAEVDEPTKKYIDLWPIQMSAEVATAGDDHNRKNVLTTNFDTYTLILQLGCILNTVPSWKRSYKLRICVFVEYETDVEEERGRVTTLLRNLRIEAEIVVLWLASGELSMYEVIVNGQDEGNFEQVAKDVDFSLEDERWWQDIKRLRQPNFMSASQELAQAKDLLEAVYAWPTASFQHGRRDTKPKRFAALQKLLRRAKNRASVSEIRDTGASVGMRSQRLSADLLLDGDSDSGVASDGDDADDEAAVTESEAGVSGSNFDEYDLDASEDDSDFSDPHRPRAIARSRTTPSGTGVSFLSKKLDLRKAIWKGSPKESSPRSSRPASESSPRLKPHLQSTASDAAISTTKHRSGKARSAASSVSQLSTSQLSSSSRAPPTIRDPESLPKFSSKTVPRTAVAQDEAPGPSIMFVDTPTATRHPDPLATATLPSPSPTLSGTHFTSSAQHSPAPSPSPATRHSTPATASPASGFPAQQAIPLSFNDLPCRAQHLILNELIRSQSEATAVVFTTLPSPMDGTCKSESESVKYVSDLEVLMEGLGPVLLVSGGSMTVTMNL